MTVISIESPNGGILSSQPNHRAGLWALALILVVGIGMGVSFLRSQDI